MSNATGARMQLPDKKTGREGRSPLDARIMLAGTPKVGKTTFAAAWAPDTTLLLDTHKGTVLLDGEHFKQPIASWEEFEQAVDLICKSDHPFKTVVVDLVEDVWKFADDAAARANGKVAAGLVEYGKGTAHAEGLFRRAVGRLLAAPVGVWFLTHTDTIEDGGVTRYVPRLDRRVKPFVQGSCDFVFLAEALNGRRRLHTQPSAKFEAGSRFALPAQIDLGATAQQTVAAARGLYAQMDKGLKAPAEQASKTEREAVPA